MTVSQNFDSFDRMIATESFFSFIFYLVLISSTIYFFWDLKNNPSKYNRGTSSNSNITPQQMRYYEKVRKEEKHKRDKEKSVKKLFAEKGQEDSLFFSENSEIELRDIAIKIYELDKSIFEFLPSHHMTYMNNENYRSGYISGLNELIHVKQPKEKRKSTI